VFIVFVGFIGLKPEKLCKLNELKCPMFNDKCQGIFPIFPSQLMPGSMSIL
jgi:hypothetical protein